MGIDLNFKKILNKLSEIHSEFPDLRFGHVVQAALDKAKKSPNSDLHDYSSKHILSCLEEFQRWCRHTRELAELKKGKKIDVPSKEIKQGEDDTRIQEYRKSLIGIKGVGNKLADDIMSVFPSKEDLLIAIQDGKKLPFPDNIEKKLKEVFTI